MLTWGVVVLAFVVVSMNLWRNNAAQQNDDHELLHTVILGRAVNCEVINQCYNEQLFTYTIFINRTVFWCSVR